MSCSHTFEGHREWIRCLKYVPGKKVDRLISGSDDYLIKVWDLESGECLKTLKGHEDSVTCFEWYNDKLISGSWDSNIRVWDINLKQNECVKTLSGHTYRVLNFLLEYHLIMLFDFLIKIGKKFLDFFLPNLENFNNSLQHSIGQGFLFLGNILTILTVR